jgi:hypothetical protein
VSSFALALRGHRAYFFSLFLVHFCLHIITEPLHFKVVHHPKLHAIFDPTPPPFSSLVSLHRASRLFGTDRVSNGGQKCLIGLHQRDSSPLAMEAAVLLISTIGRSSSSSI